MTDKTPKEKAKNLVNTQAASAKTTDTERNSEPQPTNLPSADDLKERFKAGSIPLQTDFADMIDLANIGRLAVGGAKDQFEPADGFTLSPQGLLQLKPNENKGISVDQDGVAVKVDDKGIEVDKSGVAIKEGNGIEVDQDGVAVKAGDGIKIDNKGVSLRLGKGLKHSNGDLEVNCKLNGGLSASKEGTWVIAGKGIDVNNSGVEVKAANGIEVTSNGVSVRLSNDQSGLRTDRDNSLALNKFAWLRTMCGLHEAQFYVYEAGIAVFFCNIDRGCVAYVYGRNGKYMSFDEKKIMLENNNPQSSCALFSSQGYGVTSIITWKETHANSGIVFKCEVKSFVNDIPSYLIELKLISAPVM
ncbi:hypothetical protein ABIC12_002754 [Pantoea agglomerans]|uniref:hypothetical protein n=1 Tax=Enterobacter agglomerans TaxID=549 RepID=UPI0013BE42E7|nr:hypothetical protein [Pantoea agglomerans]MDQ0430977.1 hypothetical protein [Pantoea agglomerans]NEG84937.1 hypothetical protein [Pantoea agglomerans]NEH06710.1 hypothetical protein [Pantoea agglomerans]